MNIRVERGDIAQQNADMIIVNLFEGVTSPGGGTGAVDAALDGAISQVISDGGCRGKANEMTMIHTLGKLPSPRVLDAGMGKQEAFTLDKVRALAATAARYARRARCGRIASITHGAGIAGLDPHDCAQAIAEGTIMGLYTFDRHKKPNEDDVEVQELVLAEFDESRIDALQRGVARGVVLGEAANAASMVWIAPTTKFSAQRPSIFFNAAAAAPLTPRSSSFEAFFSAGTAALAAGPILPNAETALRRTRGSGSCSAWSRAGTSAFSSSCAMACRTRLYSSW